MITDNFGHHIYHGEENCLIESVQESYHMLCYGPIKDAPLWGKIIIKISHLLITLSSALNILIYSYKVTLISLTVSKL